MQFLCNININKNLHLPPMLLFYFWGKWVFGCPAPLPWSTWLPGSSTTARNSKSVVGRCGATASWYVTWRCFFVVVFFCVERVFFGLKKTNDDDDDDHHHRHRHHRHPIFWVQRDMFQLGWFCTWKLRGHQIKSEIYIEDMILLDTHGTWWG